MAETSSSSSDEVSISEAFSILGVPLTASTAEIRKAYRSQSLKLHPDKARDVAPEIASLRFDRLQKAYEKLSDAGVREELVRRAQEETKRREKSERFESQRKKMSDELVARERQDEERRRAEKARERERWKEVQVLKEQARRMREDEARRVARQREEEGKRAARDRDAATREVRPPADDAAAHANATAPTATASAMDTTIRLLYPSDQHAALSTHLEPFLAQSFGPILRYQEAPAKKKRKRGGDGGGGENGGGDSSSPSETNVLVTFETLESAVKCVEAAGDLRLSGCVAVPSSHSLPASVLDQVWVEWGAARGILKARKAAGKSRNGGGGGGGEAGGDSVNVESGRDAAAVAEEPPRCKIGEPAIVTHWRRFDPDKLERILNASANTHKSSSHGDTVSGDRSAKSKADRNSASRHEPSPSPSGPPPPPSSAGFEADVLRRAMEAAAAKREKGARGAG